MEAADLQRLLLDSLVVCKKRATRSRSLKKERCWILEIRLLPIRNMVARRFPDSHRRSGQRNNNLDSSRRRTSTRSASDLSDEELTGQILHEGGDLTEGTIEHCEECSLTSPCSIFWPTMRQNTLMCARLESPCSPSMSKTITKTLTFRTIKRS